MKELVQNILIYTVIVSLLRGLIVNPKYGQYFQFFSGVIMILLMLSPLLSFFQGENEWYDLLEKNILKMDLTQVEGEMKLADNEFRDMVRGKYADTVEKQIKVMAEEKGVSLGEVHVTLTEGETCSIAEISGKTVLPEENADEEQSEEISVETIRIGTKGQEKERIEQEDTSTEAKRLRKQICSYFVIGEDKVHLWK